jgi:DNA-binding transcriptional regulator YiaG
VTAPRTTLVRSRVIVTGVRTTLVRSCVIVTGLRTTLVRSRVIVTGPRTTLVRSRVIVTGLRTTLVRSRVIVTGLRTTLVRSPVIVTIARTRLAGPPVSCSGAGLGRASSRVTSTGGPQGPTGDPASLTPARVAHFRILGTLGKGGMGVVYRAEDEKLRRPVAIKLLQDAGSDERRQRFLREARSAAAVTHPNVAVVHAVDEADGRIYIAMELVKLLDFGLAKTGVMRPESGKTEAGLAKTETLVTSDEGRVMGTPAYMSPEQAAAHRECTILCNRPPLTYIAIDIHSRRVVDRRSKRRREDPCKGGAAHRRPVRILEGGRTHLRPARAPSPARNERRGPRGPVEGLPLLASERTVAGHLRRRKARGRSPRRARVGARLPEVSMATKKATKRKAEGFAPERRHATLTPAKAVRIAREFQEMTQTELAAASGVPQPAIAGIESGRIALRGDRAEKLARALEVHPAVLMWPQWEPLGKRRRAQAEARMPGL